MKKIIQWLLPTLAISGFVLAANDVQVTPGTGGKFMACLEIGGICFTKHILYDTAGNPLGTSTNPLTIAGNTWVTKPTISGYTATTYQSSQAVGVVGSFTVPTVASGGQIILTFVDLKDMNGATGQPINANVDILLFDDCPVSAGVCNTGSSTFTNATNYTLNTLDASKIVARVTLQCGVMGVAGSAVNAGAAGECAAANLSIPISKASGQTIYFVVLSDGQRVQASTSDLYLQIAGTL